MKAKKEKKKITLREYHKKRMVTGIAILVTEIFENTVEHYKLDNTTWATVIFVVLAAMTALFVVIWLYASCQKVDKEDEMAKENMDNHIETLTKLRTKLIDGILERIPHTRVNGSLTHRLPGNVNFGFEFIEGEGILLLLDMLGIAASSGSACTSGSLDPSHVLMAIGLPHELAHGSLRLSIGDFTTEEDIDYIIDNLPKVIERLRSMSPLYETFVREQGQLNK